MRRIWCHSVAALSASIAFIALDASMHALAQATLAGQHDDLLLARGLMAEAIGVARRLQERGVEVVISRGATAALVAQALPDLSVVDLSTSALDLLTALEKGRREAAHVAVVAFPAMTGGAAEMGAMLGLRVTVREPAREEEFEAQILAARELGAELVVGGYVAVGASQRLGIPYVAVETSAPSILAAVEEARRIVHARSVERAKGALLRTVLASTDNGILAVDAQGCVTLVNPVAAEMLRIDAHEAPGRPVKALWPGADIEPVLASGKPALRQLHRVSAREVLCNKLPIRAGDTIVGAVVSLHDVRQIQRMEATVRRRSLETGHVASARLEDILGTSAPLRGALTMARDFAATTATVLIQGETGTGKELFAQGIHNASARADGPFVAVNCAALPGQLLESELFGYVPGAFTGASPKGKPGLFELAHGGTIFLDEIAEIDPATQGRLLRVLQEHKVMRLGSDQVVSVNLRVVAATNKPLLEMVEQGSFRDDLYYRLNVLQLRLPPLRERGADVALIARAALAAMQPGPLRRRLADDAVEVLQQHAWPGNVRELQNVLSRLVATVPDELVRARHVRPLLVDTRSRLRSHLPDPAEQIGEALARSHGRVAEAAALLGVSRSTLWRRMRRLEGR